MTEETRIKIMKELNILKEKRRSYLELKKEYDNLAKTEEVKRFLELSKQLENEMLDELDKLYSEIKAIKCVIDKLNAFINELVVEIVNGKSENIETGYQTILKMSLERNRKWG